MCVKMHNYVTYTSNWSQADTSNNQLILNFEFKYYFIKFSYSDIDVFG